MITSLIVSLFSSRWSKELTLVRPDHLINLGRGRAYMVASYADILRLSSRVPTPSSWQRSMCDKALGTSVWKARGVREFLMGLVNDPIVAQERIQPGTQGEVGDNNVSSLSIRTKKIRRTGPPSWCGRTWGECLINSRIVRKEEEKYITLRIWLWGWTGFGLFAGSSTIGFVALLSFRYPVCQILCFGLWPKMCRPSANIENSCRRREKPLVPRASVIAYYLVSYIE